MGKGLVALAFSGGLDTSFCVVWLREQGYDVATVSVDTGGFNAADKAQLTARSQELGAASHENIDARDELYDRFLKFLVFGNATRGQLYPLCVSAERVCQADVVARAAKRLGAVALCHGSTGAGNDQVRFDGAFAALAPALPVITPIRALNLSRAEETQYLRDRGFAVSDKTTDYSVNTGLWGTTVGGKETLGSWEPLPAAAYPGGEVASTLAPTELVLSFKNGVPAALNGVQGNPAAIVDELNTTGRSYGIGRGIHLGDTILGIKGRVGFEAPGAVTVVTAHRELEKLVLSGRQAFWKETLGNLYGSLLHEGLFFDPIMRDLEAFLASSQSAVTGDVRLKLVPGRVVVEGVRSPYSMLDRSIASYGETNKLWSGEEAAGFAKIYAVSQKLALRARERGDAAEGSGQSSGQG